MSSNSILFKATSLKEGCAEMWQAGGRVCLNDIPCGQSKAFVCEYSKSFFDITLIRVLFFIDLIFLSKALEKNKRKRNIFINFLNFK